MRALPQGDNDNNIVYDSFNLSHDYFKKIEPAGKFFEALVKLKLETHTFFDQFLSGDPDTDFIEEEDNVIYDWEKAYYESIKNNPIASIGKDKDNYYQLLGIEDLFLKASIDDIRKAYKKVAMIFHPDKNKTNVKHENKDDIGTEEEIEKLEKERLEKFNEMSEEDQLKEEDKIKDEVNKRWLKIKDAYDTLLDPEKRKKYDSTFDFDDEIPDANKEVNPEDFYKEFGPCFLKNSIWSKRRPIPKLGDKSTPIEKLKKFYQFWFSFDTWRDFSIEGENNLEGI
jgi:DnaJ family protein C protein 2